MRNSNAFWLLCIKKENQYYSDYERRSVVGIRDETKIVKTRIVIYEKEFPVRLPSGYVISLRIDMFRILFDYIIAEFRKDEGIDLRKDKMALERIGKAAELAIIDLSSKLKTEINLPFISADTHGPKHLLMKMTREDLDKLAKPVIKTYPSLVEQALKSAGLSLSGNWRVSLVGEPVIMLLVE